MAEKDAATFVKLVAGCRKQMESDLCELFEELEPALIKLATEHGDANRYPASRMNAAALKVCLTANWSKVAPSLRTKLAARPVRASGQGAGTTDLANLRLVSEAEEAIQIAAREVLDDVISACRIESNQLEQRLSYLVLRSAMQPGDSTFKVSALWSCIEAVCAEVATETNIRILLMQLLGKQMATEMPQLYRVVNEGFVEADILPRLKRSYRDTSPVDAHEVAAESTKMAGTLDRLAQQRTSTTTAEETHKSATASHELFTSLRTMQATPRSASSGAHTNIVRIARNSDAARDVKPAEAVTLDVVSELFDLIFSDASVSEGIKALVSRLQTTVLRAAMINQRFFADRGHPARRFLDSISVVAIRWGKKINSDDPFYLKLAELVEKVQSSYDGDMTVFDAANAELDEFLAEREIIEEKHNRELAEAVHAREEEMRLKRLAEVRAQRAANDCIARLITPEIPVEIEEFLRTYWRDVLQGRIAKSGEDGAPAAEALQAASDLLGTLAPLQVPADRQRQVAALPALVRRLNSGFDEIGTSPVERQSFMDTLMNLQLDVLRGKKKTVAKAAEQAPEAPRRSARDAGPTLQVSHETDTGIRVQDISLPDNAGLNDQNTPDRADIRRVRQLVRGDWVDFITVSETRRERLTWINPSRTLILFSNRASECALSITPDALAVRLRNGTAVIVKPDQPIFERAIQGAIKSLDRMA